MQDVIGWVSSFVLLLTILKQIHKQWKDDTSEGVSRWLYLGQMASETGFIVYSLLVRNWVFVVTNALLFCANIVGLGIVFMHRRRASQTALSRSAA